ncbi:protein GrpE [Bacteroidia bacterium]|nr:protein GrpE [Bacteroidia bacterium]
MSRKEQNQNQDQAVNAEELSDKAPIEPIEETSETQELTPMQQVENELRELNDKYLRLYSDFDNFRKRTVKERIELIQTASQDVIFSLLPVLDDFDRALTHIDNTEMKSGVELIYNKFNDILSVQGLTAIKTLGLPFDSEVAEAIAQMPTDDESKKNTVIDEVQKGYKLHDKVIRYAKVVVGI